MDFWKKRWIRRVGEAVVAVVEIGAGLEGKGGEGWLELSVCLRSIPLSESLSSPLVCTGVEGAGAANLAERRTGWGGSLGESE